MSEMGLGASRADSYRGASIRPPADLMLPARDPPLLASRALFNSAALTGIGPVAAQNRTRDS
jgi:hypothetical protein